MIDRMRQLMTRAPGLDQVRFAVSFPSHLCASLVEAQVDDAGLCADRLRNSLVGPKMRGTNAEEKEK